MQNLHEHVFHKSATKCLARHNYDMTTESAQPVLCSTKYDPWVHGQICNTTLLKTHV